MQQTTGCLDASYHARLIEMMDDVCRMANIQRQYVTTPAAQFCSEAEVAWLQRYRDDNISRMGLVITRRHNPIAVMAAMTGALIRNYIDARVQLTHELIDMDPREITVIAVPNFYLHSANAGAVAKWEAPLILEWLYARYNAGKKCILYVESMQALRNEYGNAIFDFLVNNYVILED